MLNYQTQQTARNLIMTEDEITAVLNKAHGCVESECSVDDVDDLISELKDQQKVLNERLETIMNVVSHLQHANAAEERKTDNVRSIVKDMLRVFTTQVSCLILFVVVLLSSWSRVSCHFHQFLTTAVSLYNPFLSGGQVRHWIQWRHR